MLASFPTWSSSGSVVSEDLPRPLHRIAFQGKNGAHWGLFLPKNVGRADGTLIHIGARSEKLLRKRGHEVHYDPFLVTLSSAQSVFLIPQANVSERQMKRACQDVFERKGYNMFTNNCQHFCMDVVLQLNHLFPEAVPKESVLEMEGRGTVLTRNIGIVRKDRLPPIDYVERETPRYSESRSRMSIN